MLSYGPGQLVRTGSVLGILAPDPGQPAGHMGGLFIVRQPGNTLQIAMTASPELDIADNALFQFKFYAAGAYTLGSKSIFHNLTSSLR
jgi:hypothetical protein